MSADTIIVIFGLVVVIWLLQQINNHLKAIHLCIRKEGDQRRSKT